MTRLKELGKERGYTQVKMQMLTGIDQSDYSKLESGKRNYTFEQCKRIALALDTLIKPLFARLSNVSAKLPFFSLTIGERIVILAPFGSLRI